MLNDVVFSPDGKLLITLADDQVGRIWNVGDYSKAPCDLKVEEGNFADRELLSRWRAARHTDPLDDSSWTAQVWNIAGGNCPDKPEQTFDSVTNVKWATFSPYGPGSASSGRTAKS